MVAIATMTVAMTKNMATMTKTIACHFDNSMH